MSQPDRNLEDAAHSLNARPRAVAKNALTGYLTLGLGALLGLVVTPILLRELGTTGYGVWALALGAIGYIGLLELGLGLATTTRVAATESDGPDALSRVLSASLLLHCLIAVIGILFSAGLVWLFPILFSVPDSLRSDARLSVFLVGVWLSVTFIANVYQSCLLGTGRMYVANFAGFLVGAAVSVAQVVVVTGGGGLPELGLVQALGGGVTLFAFRRAVRRALPGIRLSWRLVERRVIRRLLSLGWRNAISSAAATIAFGSDVILVGLLLSPAAAAAFAIPQRAYLLLQRVTAGVASSLGPAHAHAAAHATKLRRFRLYTLSVNVSMAFALIGGLSVAVYAEPLLDLWLSDVPPGAGGVLVALCVLLILHVPGASAYHLLLSSERATDLVRITVPAAALNVVASITLTLAFGTIGPALGSLCAAVVFDAVVLPRRVCQLLETSYKKLLVEALKPLLPASAVLAVILAAGVIVVPGGIGVLWVIGLAAMGSLGVWSRTQTARDIRRLLAESQRGEMR